MTSKSTCSSPPTHVVSTPFCPFPFRASLQTLGRHEPVNPVVTFLTPLSRTKLSARKGSMGHIFAVRVCTENRDRVSFCHFALHEVSILADLTLGHLHYNLTDVLPQSNSPPSISHSWAIIKKKVVNYFYSSKLLSDKHYGFCSFRSPADVSKFNIHKIN